MGELPTGDDWARGNLQAAAAQTAGPQLATPAFPPSRDVLPLLPMGTPVFHALPSRAIVVEALAPAVGDGIVVSRLPASAGVVLIRGGAIAESFCVDDGQTISGEEALRRITGWQDAVVSASKLSAAEADLVPTLFRGEPLYDDLQLKWVDWGGFIADLRRRSGAFVVELNTAAGRGVTSIREGAHTASYTDRHPGLGEPTALDELARQAQGSINVRCVHGSAEIPMPARAVTTSYPATAQPIPIAPVPEPVPDDVARFSESFGLRQPPQVAAAPAPAASQPVVAPGDFSVLLPDLKLLVRSRLQMASPRVEILLEDAALAGSPLECVAVQVRGTNIRGVQQSTMERLADDLLTLAAQQSR